MGLISGLGRCPGGGYGNALQCSCLQNPTDRGAWWATVHGVAKSRTGLKRPRPHPASSLRWREAPSPSGDLLAYSATGSFVAVEKQRGAGGGQWGMLSKHSCLALLTAGNPGASGRCLPGPSPPPVPRGLLHSGGHRHPRDALPGLSSRVPAADALLPSVWWSFVEKRWCLRTGLPCSGGPCLSNVTQPTHWC